MCQAGLAWGRVSPPARCACDGSLCCERRAEEVGLRVGTIPDASGFVCLPGGLRWLESLQVRQLRCCVLLALCPLQLAQELAADWQRQFAGMRHALAAAQVRPAGRH